MIYKHNKAEHYVAASPQIVMSHAACSMSVLVSSSVDSLNSLLFFFFFFFLVFLCFIEVSCLTVVYYFFVSLAQYEFRRIEKEEEVKNNTERDTFENVYIFTMWHHPKKLRNRKIKAKNRAHEMHLCKWAMWLWVCDWTATFLNKKKKKKKCLWHSRILLLIMCI